MRKLYIFVPLFFLCIVSHSQLTISYQSFITGLDFPVEVVNAGDGSNRLFIVEQPGKIKVYDPANGGLQTTPFLDMSAATNFEWDERGVLSMAFHPQYEVNGYFFVYYTNLSDEIAVARYQVSANRNIANAASATVLFSIPKPSFGHNGGHLQFGQDGHLYFATGDGYANGNDPANNAQNGLSLLGKMIRINVDNFLTPPYYTVPATNPFVGNPSYDSRIWALGLRNPFRWSFDRLTGDMWIGDVGQANKEEINFTPASSTGGENYGWRCYEGSIPNPNIAPCTVPNYQAPIFDYDNPPGTAGASVIGGYVYRGTEYPFLNGYYIASDLYSGALFLIKKDGFGNWVITQLSGQAYISSYGEAEDGTLYATSLATNQVLKITASSSTLPVNIRSFNAFRSANGNVVTWNTSLESNVEKFTVEFGKNGNSFIAVGELNPSGNSSGASYSFTHKMADAGPYFYRLAITEKNGGKSYSKIVRIEGNSSMKVFPTIVRDGRLYIDGNKIKKIQVLNMHGSLVYEKVVNSSGYLTTFQLPASLSKGMYIVRIDGEQDILEKIIIE